MTPDEMRQDARPDQMRYNCQECMKEGRRPEDYEGKEELETVAPEDMSPPHLHKQKKKKVFFFFSFEKGHSVC